MNILIISPYYPPESTVAVVRMASLSRFLIECNHDVTVLRNRYNMMNDKQNPQMEIPSGVKAYEVGISTKGSGFKAFQQNYKNYLAELNTLLANETFDVTIISAGPFYTLPLTKYLKVKHKMNCIVDFRDLWTFDYRGIKQLLKIKNILTKPLSYLIELRSLKYADKVVTVTSGWRNKLIKYFPMYKEKFYVIYNGYDDSLLVESFLQSKSDEIILGFFGKLSYYSHSYTLKFFEAVKSLIDTYELKILQVGDIEEETINIMSSLDYPKTDFTYTGFMDYKAGIQVVSSSRVFIIIDIRDSGLGTKVYDYIYMNKPIIYIGKKNTDLANFVSGFVNGYACETVDEITEALETIVENDVYHLYDDLEKSEYSRSYQNQRYLELIRSTIVK